MWLEGRTMEDRARVERFRGHVESAIPRAVSLALDDMPAATWERLYHAFLHDGRVWLRAELQPAGVTVQVLTGWEAGEPEPLHTYTIRRSDTAAAE